MPVTRHRSIAIRQWSAGETPTHARKRSRKEKNPPRRSLADILAGAGIDSRTIREIVKFN